MGSFDLGSSAAMMMADLRVAILVPCYNEEVAIGTVVRDFRAALPTAGLRLRQQLERSHGRVARAAGAEVRHVPQQGKGHVVRRMFADVEADIYVLVDGDDTYDAPTRPRWSRALAERLDMVVGGRADRRRPRPTGPATASAIAS